VLYLSEPAAVKQAETWLEEVHGSSGNLCEEEGGSPVGTRKARRLSP
jgi:hypothetical protein